MFAMLRHPPATAAAAPTARPSRRLAVRQAREPEAAAQALPNGVQLAMQRVFRADFSSVRVHAGPDADARTRSANARALTLGEDIYFRYGAYRPEGREGGWLLAHELAHVVQQSRTPAPHRALAKMTDGEDRDHLELEADRCAHRAMRGEAAPVLERTATPMSQAFADCRSLLDAPEGERVPEKAVQADIARRMAGLGEVERELPIPAGSYVAYSGKEGVSPSGGFADIALLRGKQLEIAEVKRGVWPEGDQTSNVVDGERQLLNYVEKASADIEGTKAVWGGRRKTDPPPIDTVVEMPSNRISFPTPLRIGFVQTDVTFCRDGLIAFKGKTTHDEEEQLRNLDALRQELQRRVDSAFGSHKAQSHLIYTPSVTGFVGYWTNHLFNSDVPPLEIWNTAYNALSNASIALQNGNVKEAQRNLIAARRAYLVANRRYQAWRDGVDGAGAQAQLAIAGIAVLTVAAFAAPAAIGAAAGAGTTTGSAAATTATAVRVMATVAKADEAFVAIDALSSEADVMAEAEIEAEKVLYR